MIFKGFKGSRIQGFEWKEQRYALTSQISRAAVNNGDLKALKDDTEEVERMLKALIKSLENKRLTPRILFSNYLEKNLKESRLSRRYLISLD